MDYRQMLERQPQDQMILIEDGVCVTYCQILELAQEMKEKISPNATVQQRVVEPESVEIEKRIYFIQKATIVEELAAFIACQGSRWIPVIAAEDVTEEEQEYLSRTEVPGQAVMGVLTSGTTGRHKILFRTYESWADFFPYQNRIFSMDGDTVLFAQGSLAFTGNMNLYMALFSQGGTVVATKRFDPRYWLSLIKEYGVNYLYLIPAKMMALCQVADVPYTGVRHFVTGSQSFGKRELQKTRRSFPEISVVLYYGCSEANYITYLTDSEMTGDDRLVGRAFPEVDVSIRNGLFYVENVYGIIGIEHPFCTKDLGSVDEAGRFYFEGRQDDLLNVNGRKCSAYRIERAMREKLGVAGIAKVRKEADRDILVAYYECEREIPSLSIRKQLRELLPEYEIPKQFVRVDELYKTDSGKLRR